MFHNIEQSSTTTMSGVYVCESDANNSNRYASRLLYLEIKLKFHTLHLWLIANVWLKFYQGIVRTLVLTNFMYRAKKANTEEIWSLNEHIKISRKSIDILKFYSILIFFNFMQNQSELYCKHNFSH